MKTKYIFTLSLMMGALTGFAQELALVRENGNFGYIDRSANFVIAPEFEDAKSFSDGLAAAEQDKLWGFIDASGKWAIEPKYDKVKYFNSGYALVLKDDQWQYIDKKGQPLDIPSTTEKLYDFEEGVAFFRNGEKIGLLGTDGKLVLAPTYDVIKDIKNGHAKVKKGELWGMIDTSGKEIIPTEYEDIGNMWSPNGVFGKKDGVYGIVHDGKFNPIDGATDVWPFHGDATLTYAERDKKIGFVDSTGKWVIAPQFDKARAFSNGLAPVAKGKMWGYINEQGEMVIEPQYRDAEVFSDGMAPVKDKDWGFIDTSGKLVIPMDYDITAGLAFLSGRNEKGFSDGLTRVKTKKGWGFLDKNGKLLGDTWFENAEPFETVP
ncbi:MAG: WG repeat-containing protein [Pricia sp.]